MNTTKAQLAFMTQASINPEEANLALACSIFKHKPSTLKGKQAWGGLTGSLVRKGLGVKLKSGGFKLTAAGLKLLGAAPRSKLARPHEDVQPQTLLAKIRGLQAAKKTITEIGTILGVHRSTISRTLLKASKTSKSEDAL